MKRWLSLSDPWHVPNPKGRRYVLVARLPDRYHIIGWSDDYSALEARGPLEADKLQLTVIAMQWFKSTDRDREVPPGWDESKDGPWLVLEGQWLTPWVKKHIPSTWRPGERDGSQ